MAYGMNISAYVRKYGTQPNHLYDKESKPNRKVSNRKARKRAKTAIKDPVADWDCKLLPLPPKTSGWLTI